MNTDYMILAMLLAPTPPHVHPPPHPLKRPARLCAPQVDAIIHQVIVVYAQGEGAMAYPEMTSFLPFGKPLPLSARPYPDITSGIMPPPYDQLVTFLGIHPGILVDLDMALEPAIAKTRDTIKKGCAHSSSPQDTLVITKNPLIPKPIFHTQPVKLTDKPAAITDKPFAELVCESGNMHPVSLKTLHAPWDAGGLDMPCTNALTEAGWLRWATKFLDPDAEECGWYQLARYLIRLVSKSVPELDIFKTPTVTLHGGHDPRQPPLHRHH